LFFFHQERGSYGLGTHHYIIVANLLSFASYNYSVPL
jgi:hypothetical protein